MSNTYEAMLLLDNREVKKGWEECKSGVTGLFTKHSAEVLSARRWDETRLAYPIENQLRGTYLLMYFKSEGDSLASIRRDLEYSESVLRHLTLRCEEVPPEAYEPEAEFSVDDVRVEEYSAHRPPEPAPEAPAEEAKGGEAKDGEAKDAEGEAAEGEAKAEATGDEASAEATPAADGESAASEETPEKKEGE